MAGYFSNFPKVSYRFNPIGITQNVVDIFRHARSQDTFIDNPLAYQKYTIIDGERPDVVSQRLYGTPDLYWTFFVINESLNEVYSDWPMSQEALNKYIDYHFSGQVIETYPEVARTTDQLVNGHPNSLAGTGSSNSTNFSIGDTITGSLSGASGTLFKKNLDMSQLVIRDIDGSFIENEGITGGGDPVTSYKVFEERLAPLYWYESSDPEKRPVTPNNVINTPLAVPRASCSYVSIYEHIININQENSQIKVIDPKYINQFVADFRKIIND
jgi:hypothetical protein